MNSWLCKGKREAALLLALLVPALAGAEARLCLKKAAAAAAVDGIVAPGEPTPQCPSDDLWATVGPAAFGPDASGVKAHMYMALVGTDRLRVGIDTAGDTDVSDHDIVMLYFDANNNGAWDNGDFALSVAVSPSPDYVDQGEACGHLAAGPVSYWQYQNGSWVPDQVTAAKITAQYSYDFSAPDNEHDIWNVEFEFQIPASGPLHLNLDGPKFFAAGGFVFVDNYHQQAQVGQVVSWPDGLTSVKNTGLPDITQEFSPSLSAPDPAALAKIKLEGACGFDVNFDMAEEPWVINGNPAHVAGGETSEYIKRNAMNDFRVTYYLDGPGDAPQTISSPGQVTLGIRPYNGGAPTAGDWVQTAPVDNTPMYYNATHSVDFHYDFTKAPSPQFNAAETKFVCADANLEKFVLDDDKSNNHVHLNLNYFATSEFRDSLKIYGPSKEMAHVGPAKKIYIQIDPRNEARSLHKAEPAFARKSECGDDRPEARWNIANARELGLEPVKGMPNWYAMPLTAGEVKSLDLRFEGKPLDYKMQTHRLVAAEQGRPGRLDLPVRPGTVVTLLAWGEVDVDGKEGPLPPTTAAGFTQPAAAEPRTVREQLSGDSFFKRDIKGRPLPPSMQLANRYLLKEGYYTPSEHVGALIGSFDGFRTSFVVGRHKSFIVPHKAERLSLAVNGTMKSYGSMIGAYEIGEIVTEAPRVPTKTVPNGNATWGVPNTVQPWDALTSLNIYTYYADDLIIGPGAPVARTFRAWGDAHYVLYASHAGEAPTGAALSDAALKDAKQVRE